MYDEGIPLLVTNQISNSLSKNVFFLYSNSGGKRIICNAKIVFSSSNIKIMLRRTKLSLRIKFLHKIEYNKVHIF